MEPKQAVQEYPSLSSRIQDDEIDLIDLFQKLWQQRILIGAIAGVITLLGIVYAFSATPIYQARAQLQIPTAAELAPLNSSSIYKITPEEVFKKFLTILESDSHKTAFIQNNLESVKENLRINTTSSANESLTKIRRISYPNKKSSEIIEPDIYSISLDGPGKAKLAELLDNDIKLASSATLAKIRNDLEKIRQTEILTAQERLEALVKALAKRRENKITQLQEAHQLALLKLNDEINARKNYVLNNRKNRIESLKQAINIAKQLKIVEPVTLAKLASADSNRQVEINADLNNKREPLYLKGTRLLSAELDNLSNMPDSLFLDEEIIKLESELLRLKNNRNIEVLERRKNDDAFSKEVESIKEKISQLEKTNIPKLYSINLQNNKAIVKNGALEPRKALIIAISLILGFLIGVIITIFHVAVKKRTT